MDDRELSRIEDELRAIIAEAGLAWVLSRLEEVISYGVVEDRSIDGYESLKFSMASEWTEETSGRRVGGSSRVGITTRPQTVLERVLSLLGALERVTIELPVIEQDTLGRLIGPTGEKQAAARIVRFLPDEDMIGGETSLKISDNEDEQRRLAFGRLLPVLREAVRS